MLYSRSIFFQALSFISIVVTVARAQTCWYSDGKTQAFNSAACHRGTHSTCCDPQADGSPSYCLSNGLCLTDLVVIRGSCTDATWQSPACSTYCPGTRNASNALIPCGNNTWSCSKDCTKSTFTIQAGTLELSPAQKSNIGVAGATATVFSDSNLDQSYSRGTLAAVGAGIGGPLALALGLFITLFCVERRRNKNLSKQRSPRLPRLPPYKSSPSSPEPLLNRNPAKSPRWQDQKFSYDSKTHFSNLPRTDSKCVHDSKSHYDTQIQHSRRSPTDVRRSPTHAKKSPTKQRMGLQRSITEPLPLLPLPPQELRAPTPVAELDVRPNSRVPRVDF